MLALVINWLNTNDRLGGNGENTDEVNWFPTSFDYCTSKYFLQNEMAA